MTIKQDCPPHRYVDGRCVNRAVRTDGNPEGIMCRARESVAEPDYPEHEKLRAVSAQSQKCGEFFDWLTGRYTLGEYHVHSKHCQDEDGRACSSLTDTLYPAAVNIRKLLAEFFEIDEAKLEEEKRAMLEKLRR